MENNAINLGNGIGKILEKTPIRKLAKNASKIIDKISDQFVKGSEWRLKSFLKFLASMLNI